MGRHTKHPNTNRPHLPAWVKAAAPYPWRFAATVAAAAVAAIIK